MAKQIQTTNTKNVQPQTTSTTMKPTQTQANLLSVNVDEVWEKFLDKSGWDSDNVDEERKAIETRIASKEEQIARLQAEISTLKKDLGSIDNREKTARKYLHEAATTMGRFATEAVLLAALYEEFPSAKPRVGRKAGSTVGAKNVSQESLEAVKSVLDHDGLTFGEVGKALPNMSKDEIRASLKLLVARKQATTIGEKRGTKYLIP